MDQDDRQDASANKSPVPNTQENTPSYTPNREFSAAPDTPHPMTHTRINIETPNQQSTTESAQINTIEAATVGPEVEPATTAYTQGDPQPAVVPTPAQFTDDGSESQVYPNPQTQLEPMQIATPLAVRPRDKKRLLLIVAAAVILLAVIGGLAWWLLLGGNTDEVVTETVNDRSSSTEQSKLGVALTVIEGTVEYSVDDREWFAASEGIQMKEGNFIRTGNESRTVLALDDGSAVRLDSSTTIKIVSLATDNVQITQMNGLVYSRVIPSERNYSVVADDSTYEALGTAFITIMNQSENGVQVYQSSVKVSESDEAVSEGKQFYKNSSDASIQGKLTDINIDAMVDNAFVNWNLIQDENDTNFKEKLGILSKIKERSAEREVERLAAEEQKKKEVAAKAVTEKQKTEQIEKEKEKTPVETKPKVTRGDMKLNRSGKTFSWTYTGKAVYGYKLVFAKRSSDAYFGNKNASSIHISNMDQMSSQFPKGKDIDGDYYVRVCAYTANTETEACVDYSNVKEIEV